MKDKTTESDISATRPGLKVGQFSVISPAAVIGNNVRIDSHVFVPNDAVLGEGVHIESGVCLPEGIRIGDDTTIGANATFAKRADAKHDGPTLTTIHRGCAVGANTTILIGLTIGRQAVIAPGSLIQQDAPAYSVIEGNPGRIVGYSTQRSSPSPTAPRLPLGSARTMKGVDFVQLTKASDMRGDLLAIELEQQIPFQVKRVFTVMNVPSHHIRGEHAHKLCHQLLVCLQGSITVSADNGNERMEWVLERPDVGLHILPYTWAAQYRYSPDAVLAVFASHPYDADDYIRDYEEYLTLVKSR